LEGCGVLRLGRVGLWSLWLLLCCVVGLGAGIVGEERRYEVGVHGGWFDGVVDEGVDGGWLE